MPRMEGSAARQLEQEYSPPEPPSERKESVVQEDQPESEKPAAEEERKVIIRKDEERKLAETRAALLSPTAEKFKQRSSVERDLATDIIHRMNVDLERGLSTDAKMREYRHELAELRDRLEDLQAHARKIHGSERLGGIVNQNYKALEKISTALQASAMEEADARHALSGITPKVEIRDEAKTSRHWERDIEDRYGADPETLRAGSGPFWQRNLFNIKHWLAQKTHQPSEYDLYRQALERERRASGTPSLTIAETEEGRVPTPPEKLMEELRKSERQAAPMTIERAHRLVPHSADLWNLSKERLASTPYIAPVIDQLSAKYGVSFGEKDPATQFVLLVGKYLDTRDNLRDADAAEELHHDIMKVAGDLKIKTNNLITQALAEGKPHIKDVTAGVKRRRAATSARERRWNISGRNTP